MDKYTFYDSLKKYKKNAIKHAADYGQGFYQKIDKYYPDGSARYFYSKAAWDAYLEEQRRNAYEKQQKDLKEKEKAADEAKKSTGAKATADIEANERTKWEQAKSKPKQEVKQETKPTQTYNQEKDQKEAEERTKWEQEKAKKIEEVVNKKLYNVKKDMKDLADTFEKNRELPNVAPDAPLSMIKGQTDKTITDLMESGITDTTEIQEALKKKETEFKNFLTEKIGPEWEDFVTKTLDGLTEDEVKEIIDTEGVKLIDSFVDKHKDTIDKIKKEYQDIYGIVETFKKGDYDGMAYASMVELYKKKLKNTINDKLKEWSNKIDNIIETPGEIIRKNESEMAANFMTDTWLGNVLWNLSMEASVALSNLFGNGENTDYEWKWTYNKEAQDRQKQFDPSVVEIMNTAKELSNKPKSDNAMSVTSKGHIGLSLDPANVTEKVNKENEKTKKMKQNVQARNLSKTGDKYQEEQRSKMKEIKKTKAQKILSEELQKGYKYAKKKIL